MSNIKHLTQNQIKEIELITGSNFKEAKKVEGYKHAKNYFFTIQMYKKGIQNGVGTLEILFNPKLGLTRINFSCFNGKDRIDGVPISGMRALLYALESNE